MTRFLLVALLLSLPFRLIASQGYEPPQDYKDYFKKPMMPYPIGNKPSPAKATLGHDLFFDPILSGDNAMSCATCHQPEKGWTDGLPLAVGKNGAGLRRRTPTLINVGYEEALFWDGRARQLEEQVLIPILDPQEMAQNPDELLKELNNNKDYAARFRKIFPQEGINLRTVAAVIASFLRTIVSEATSFDAFIGGDMHAISESAKRGLGIFNVKGHCVRCHAGWRFSDGSLHDTGLKTDDLGAFNFLPNEKFRHAFKTPTLRGVTKRGPYMHNGSLKTIADIVDFYDRGGDLKRPSVSPHIRALRLSPAEKKDLIEFLKTL